MNQSTRILMNMVMDVAVARPIKPFDIASQNWDATIPVIVAVVKNIKNVV